MAIIRSNPRSSDSIDFEYTATTKEIEELLMAEMDYISPNEEPVPSERHAVTSSFSFPFPNTTVRRPSHDGTNKRSPSTTKVPQNDNSSEKIEVYNDADGEPRRYATRQAHTSEIATPCTRTKAINATMTSAVDDCVNYAEQNLPILEDDAFRRNRSGRNHVSFTSTSTLVTRLRGIAAQRALLLHQLNELQKEEQCILVSLVPPSDAGQNTSPPRHVLCHPFAPRVESSTRLLNAPVLPEPALLPSRVPHTQPFKASCKPLKTRTRSAPTLSTPFGAQRLVARMGMRVPLAGKTSEREGLAGTGDISNHPTTSVPARAELALRQHLESPSLLEDNTSQLEIRSMTSKVPIRFGPKDDDTTALQDPPPNGNAASKASHSRHRSISKDNDDNRRKMSSGTNKSKSKSKSRSRSRGRTQFATPGLSRFTELPHAVSRKVWNF